MVKIYRCKNAMEMFGFVGSMPESIKIVDANETRNKIDMIAINGCEADLDAYLAQHLSKADWYTMEEV